MSQHQTADIVAQILSNIPELQSGPDRENSALEGIFAQQLADTGLTNEKEKAPAKPKAPIDSPDLRVTENEALGRQLVDFFGGPLGAFAPNPVAIAGNAQKAFEGEGGAIDFISRLLTGGSLDELSEESLNQVGAGASFPGNPGNQAAHALASQRVSNAFGIPVAALAGVGVESLEAVINLSAGNPFEQEEGDALRDMGANLTGILMGGEQGPVGPGRIDRQPFEAGQKPISALGGGVEELLGVLSQLFGVQGSRAGEAPQGTQTVSGIRE